MTETELKLLLLRYNTLSKERADAAYMWRNAGESLYYEARWSNCVDDMKELEESARKDGYRFIATGARVKGKVQSDVYTLVKIDE